MPGGGRASGICADSGDSDDALLAELHHPSSPAARHEPAKLDARFSATVRQVVAAINTRDAALKPLISSGNRVSAGLAGAQFPCGVLSTASRDYRQTHGSTRVASACGANKLAMGRASRCALGYRVGACVEKRSYSKAKRKKSE